MSFSKTLMLRLCIAAAAVSVGQAAQARELETVLPVMNRHLGTWEGVYTRVDETGQIKEVFDSLLTMEYDAETGYRQTNRYSRDGETFQVIEASGELRGNQLHFSSGPVSGWVVDLESDPQQRSVILQMVMPGSHCVELIQLSEAGDRRERTLQCMGEDGSVRRTLIRERRVP